MPRIKQSIIDSVFYLYRTKEDADAGLDPQGTGFVVSYDQFKDGIHYVDYYGVTNWHVARRGASVTKLIRIDGVYSIFEFGPEEWECIPGGPDIAAVNLDLDPQIHKCNSISTRQFLSANQTRTLSVGEDVFMLGLFIDAEGIVTNNPQARFGNISMIASENSKIRQETGYEGQSYIVDTHSRPGFSGSPVFVYRTPFDDFSSSQQLRGDAHSESIASKFKSANDHRGTDFDISIKLSGTLFALLGIHWGQFSEKWPVYKSPDRASSGNALDPIGGYAMGVSGMTLVIPSFEIMRLLDIANFSLRRSEC